MRAFEWTRSTASLRRALAAFLLAAALASLTGCGVILAEVFNFGVQHSIGAKLGPCEARKDSVKRVRGPAFWSVIGDEEDVSTGEQLFQHEWGYTLPLPSRPDSARADSLLVVRFRWGDGVSGCDVSERLVRRETGRRRPPW